MSNHSPHWCTLLSLRPHLVPQVRRNGAPRGQAELGQDVRDVGGYRAIADAERIRDLLISPSGREQMHHFKLTLGQRGAVPLDAIQFRRW